MDRHWSWVGILASGALLRGAAGAFATEQAVIDLSINGGMLTHPGSGLLHSIDPSNPPDSLVTPLGLQVLRMRPDAALQMAPRAQQLGVKAIQVVVSDGFNPEYDGPYPGDGGNWTPWEAYVSNLAQQAASSPVPIQFDVWNEPDLGAFWARDKATYLEAWRRAVVQIRAVSPQATIVGPSFSNINNTKIGVQDFLTYARDNNVLPDVMAWHEFNPTFTSNVASVRSLMAADGINVNRISLNEIVGQTTFAGTKQWAVAGPLAQYFANLSRAGVESAAHAVWDEPDFPGVNNGENASLDGLLTPDTKQPRSTWWMYERYAEMGGTLAGFQPGVVKNGSGIVTFDGLATGQDGKVQVLFGRDQPSQLDSSPVELKFTNLNLVPNLINADGNVLVTGEQIVNSGMAAASGGPTQVFSLTMPVAGGQLIVPVSQFGSTDGFFLTITPVGTTGGGGDGGDPTGGGNDGPVVTWIKDTGGAWWDEFAWDNVTPNGPGAGARVAAANVGQRTIYVDTPWTLGRLYLDDPAGCLVTGAATLTMDNGSFRGLFQATAGVNELSVRVEPGPSGLAPNIVVGEGATLRIAGGIHMRIADVTLHTGGTLDLADGQLLVDPNGSLSRADLVRQLLRAGYGGGAWDGAGGLKSSAITPSGDLTLAYAEAGLVGLTTFDGQGAAARAVLVLLTVPGDVNCDGVLDASDLALVDRGFARHPASAHWTDGDLNYDGVVDAADYLLIDTAWARQYGGLAPAITPRRWRRRSRNRGR
jgi:hypothetical protein